MVGIVRNVDGWEQTSSKNQQLRFGSTDAGSAMHGAFNSRCSVGFRLESVITLWLRIICRGFIPIDDLRSLALGVEAEPAVEHNVVVHDHAAERDVCKDAPMRVASKELPDVPYLVRPIDRAGRSVDEKSQGAQHHGDFGIEFEEATCEQEVDKVGASGEDGVDNKQAADIVLCVVIVNVDKVEDADDEVVKDGCFGHTAHKHQTDAIGNGIEATQVANRVGVPFVVENDAIQKRKAKRGEGTEHGALQKVAEDVKLLVGGNFLVGSGPLVEKVVEHKVRTEDDVAAHQKEAILILRVQHMLLENVRGGS
eukprot:m.287282 g.287282  ORF g.287282 m.287282 type:complete len:310 (+) comp11746_c0_seq1:249-1178(+)